MNDLNKKAFEGLLQLLVAMAALVFFPAWTLNYWQAWVFLGAFFLPVLAITLYLMKHDPKLLERRVHAGPGAEKVKKQKMIQLVASLAFISVFVLSALDHRFEWSHVSTYLVVIGDILVVLGLISVFFVFKENSFTSGTIDVESTQKVISTGPYAFVRHPMYAGAFVMLFGIPPALGSWWGLWAVIPMILAIIWRLLEEEKFLIKKLQGYSSYKNKVKYRLIPFIW